MLYTIPDRVMDTLDELWRGVRGWTKADHSQYLPIACKHSEYVLALENGSLMSVIKIEGYMGQFFQDRFVQLQKRWTDFLRNVTKDKSAKGFDLYWSYEFDPDGMALKTREYRRRLIKAAERRGLAVGDIIQEEAALYGRICADEQQYLMIVTHLDSLPKADHKGARAAATEAQRRTIRGADAIAMQRGVKAIEAVHEQHVNKVLTFMDNLRPGYTADRLPAKQALWYMRHSLVPGTTGKGWSPRLTMNDCRLRPTEHVPKASKIAQQEGAPNDWSFFLPPPLASQMVPDGAVDLGKYSVVGDRIYAPMYVSELATDPRPLEDLLAMCYARRVPVRIVYSLMSNSDQANYWNRLFAGIFTFASVSNKQIKKADWAMKAYQEADGAVLGYGLSVATWSKLDVSYDAAGAPIYHTENIQKNARDLETFLQQWGNQQVDNVFGCSVEATFSATPGYCIPPAVPKAPQIESDIAQQLPLMRPARLWAPDNGIWYRTDDGVLLPHQPFSKLQNAMLMVIMGGMGYGKSNSISEHIFYFANHPEAAEMPYIRGIDFGASSSGVIDLIKESLPADEKHLAMFETFSNSGSMVKNMLDTRLGLKYPLDDHESFLMSWLVTICDGLIAEAGISNLVAVFKASINRAYAMRDPGAENLFDPVIFRLHDADPIVVSAIERSEIEIDEATHYWEVTDALIEYGLANNEPSILHAAKIAQRRAVPKFPDLIRACDQLASQFEDAPQVGGKNITAAVANALMNANTAFPCFAGVTNTDVSESRVCVFDMTDVFGRGATAYDDWKRSVFFAVVLRLLTEDLFVNEQYSGGEIRTKKKKLGISEELLTWHIDYLKKQDEVLKLFWGDELHRVGRVEGAFRLLDSMAFEGRKYRVGLMLGTQMPEGFPENVLKLSSSKLIFGASQSAANADVMQRLFDLSDDERQIVLDITKPNAEKGAEVFVIHNTERGVQKLKLHFHVGSIKRWAYATEPDEKALRKILYSEGPSGAWARKVLAERVPNCEKEVKRRRNLAVDDSVSDQQIYREIATELLKLA